MKAIVYEKFGPPEVLQLRDVEKPTPNAKEILVRNYATVVAAEDPGMRASPGLNGFLTPRKAILGQELAGEIEAVGKEVTRFRVGDRVYGEVGMGLGAYAEYICVSEDSALAIIPERLSYAEAAAIPNGALTALPFLRDAGKLQAGQDVLIYGASGAVGTAAVQLATAFGAHVTGVCSTANLDLVASLGAEEVIDYTQSDFTKNGATYDIIFDTVGKASYSKCKPSLNAHGIYLTTVPKPGLLFHIPWTAMLGGRKARTVFAGLKKAALKREYLNFYNDLIASGDFNAVIDRIYPMEQIADAHRYVALGHKKGNVVITID